MSTNIKYWESIILKITSKEKKELLNMIFNIQN